jgi:peptidoglycan-associated lipoprotein
VVIDGVVVLPSGSRLVSPASSTTYSASAEGPGGTTSASARITVLEHEKMGFPPSAARTLTDAEFVDQRISDIFFDLDKHDLRADAVSALDSNREAMVERAAIHFTIEGHCDERGSERYNLALGDRRAQAAKQYLVGQGIAAIRLDTISYGEERPFESGHSEDAWARNRRAHFVVKPAAATN